MHRSSLRNGNHDRHTKSGSAAHHEVQQRRESGCSARPVRCSVAMSGAMRHTPMLSLNIGYAGVSTDQLDRTAQRDGL